MRAFASPRPFLVSALATGMSSARSIAEEAEAPMPNLKLTRYEVDDLLADIESLKTE